MGVLDVFRFLRPHSHTRTLRPLGMALFQDSRVRLQLLDCLPLPSITLRLCPLPPPAHLPS